MPDWSIRIVPNPIRDPARPALLVPDLVGAHPGDPLYATVDDLVSWGNESGQPYQPWPTDQNGNLQALGGKLPPQPPFSSPFPNFFLSNMIPASRSSPVAYNVVMPKAGKVIFYCLVDANGKTTNVRGQIIVSDVPQALNVPSVGA